MVFIQHCFHLEQHCFHLDRQFSCYPNISNWLSRFPTQSSLVIQNSCSSWLSCTLSVCVVTVRIFDKIKYCMFQITMIQGVIHICSINIKIQQQYFPRTPLIITLPLDLVARGFVITWLAHRLPQGRGFVLLKVFPARMISVYVAHMIDIFSNISRQRRCNTTPIGFGGWVEILIKINWNWPRCCKYSQFGG